MLVVGAVEDQKHPDNRVCDGVWDRSFVAQKLRSASYKTIAASRCAFPVFTDQSSRAISIITAAHTPTQPNPGIVRPSASIALVAAVTESRSLRPCALGTPSKLFAGFLKCI